MWQIEACVYLPDALYLHTVKTAADGTFVWFRIFNLENFGVTKKETAFSRDIAL